MQLLGADPHAFGLREQPLEGRVNYFMGKDPSKWHTDIPTFGKVGFRQIYPGVDVVYYGNQQRLEYDFVVAPHADPRQIQLRFAGAQHIRVNKAGYLIVESDGRELTWKKPTVYQQEEHGRHTVAAHFRLKHMPNGRTGVRFALGNYDTSRSLVIDPVLLFASRLEGTPKACAALAVDSAGNAYVTGTTDDSSATGRDYVIKLNPAGTALLYQTYLGPTNYSTPAIAIDSSGSAYITGSGTSAFPTTPGAYKTQQADGDELFVAKLNPAGSGLVYSTFVGKNNYNNSRSPYDHGIGIAVDSSGNAYVTGAAGSGFPTTPGAFQTANKATNGVNAFVTKLNPTGTALVYSTYLGGSVDIPAAGNGDAGRGIAVDSSGSAYIVGSSGSTDFPTTPGAFQRVNKAYVGSYSAFVAKLNPTGSALTYSTLLGGRNNEVGYGIAIDNFGDAYVVGEADSSDFPTTPGAFQAIYPGQGAFVTKLNPTGTSLIYSTHLGPDGIAYGVCVDSNGSAYVTGTAKGFFPTTSGAFQRDLKGWIQAFMARLNPAGSALLYSTYLGGVNQVVFFGDGDGGQSVALDGSGNVYVSGYAPSPNFPTTPGAFQVASGTTFVTKLAPINVFPDFNNDGFTDLLIQNSDTGVIASWFMQGAQWNNGAYFSQTPTLDQKLVGAGDFGNGGIITLVLQSTLDNKITMWTTRGSVNSNVTSAAVVDRTPDPGWSVAGVGDFNKSGTADLVFQNQTTGQVAVWFMISYQYQGGVLLSAAPLPGWKLVGVGDFNKDGFPDLAFQNQTTGQIALWYMNGTTYVGGTVLTTVPAAGWKVVGVGDYNGDGSADLLFQNQTTNQAVVWYLQDGAYAGGASLSLTPPPGWKIVGPR
jgi:hypothetical protein